MGLGGASGVGVGLGGGVGVGVGVGLGGATAAAVTVAVTVTAGSGFASSCGFFRSAPIVTRTRNHTEASATVAILAALPQRATKASAAATGGRKSPTAITAGTAHAGFQRRYWGCAGG